MTDEVKKRAEKEACKIANASFPNLVCRKNIDHTGPHSIIVTWD